MVKYVCTGTCGGSVSEEEFLEGKNKCATKGCPEYGTQLVKET